jgi:hypothetical protein
MINQRDDTAYIQQPAISDNISPVSRNLNLPSKQDTKIQRVMWPKREAGSSTQLHIMQNERSYAEHNSKVRINFGQKFHISACPQMFHF